MTYCVLFTNADEVLKPLVSLQAHAPAQHHPPSPLAPDAAAVPFSVTSWPKVATLRRTRSTTRRSTSLRSEAFRAASATGPELRQS